MEWMELRPCEKYHQMFEHLANGPIQTGELPPELRVIGNTAWWVYRGSHDGMGAAWGEFGRRVQAATVGGGSGPMGDIYLCDPNDHPDSWEEMLTMLWSPRS